MRRSAYLIGLALTAAAIPAGAATVVDSGLYTGGQTTMVSGNFGLAPGTHRVTLDLTGPANAVVANIISSFTINYYCDSGAALVRCGGGDFLNTTTLAPLSPTQFIANITVAPFISGPFDIGGPAVAFDQSNSCCGYEISFAALADGAYTLSHGLVPEPATWALMLFGVGFTGAAMRRQRAGTRKRALTVRTS